MEEKLNSMTVLTMAALAVSAVSALTAVKRRRAAEIVTQHRRDVEYSMRR